MNPDIIFGVFLGLMLSVIAIVGVSMLIFGIIGVLEREPEAPIAIVASIIILIFLGVSLSIAT